MNADSYNYVSKEVDIYGPSLLSLATLYKTYIVDMVNLGMVPNLDIVLTKIFTQSNATFVAFGVQTLINYFMKFYKPYQFLKRIDKIIDIRIMYHKIKLKNQRSFASIFQTLFAERLDMSEYLTDWEQRPLTRS